METNKKMLEANEQLSKKLESIEDKIAKGASPAPSADKKEETKKEEPKLASPAPQTDIPDRFDYEAGWSNVQEFFKGRQGVPKARKFIKFLNMLTMLEEPY
jgi:hypothetical protein